MYHPGRQCVYFAFWHILRFLFIAMLHILVTVFECMLFNLSLRCSWQQANLLLQENPQVEDGEPNLAGKSGFVFIQAGEKN